MANQFDDTVREFFQRQFNLFDKDQSQTIPTEELGNCLRMCGQVPLEAEIPPLQADADPENKGAITFDDFCRALFNCMTTPRTQHDLKEAFRAFDPDERGTISQHELRYILTTMGDKLTDEEVNLFIEEMKTEVDMDGNIVYSDASQKLLPEFLR
jgi:calmodulin